MKKIISLSITPLFILFCVINSINATSKQDALTKYGTDIKVATIQVVGYKNIKSAIIDNITNPHLIVTLADFKEEEIKSRLFKIGLFSDVKFYYTLNKVTKLVDVIIVVDQKSSRIIIPVFSSGGGGSSFGFFLLESNLFKSNKSLVVGGAAGAGDIFAIVSLTDPKLFNSRYSMTVKALVVDEVSEYTNLSNTTYTKYKINKNVFALAIGRDYKFLNIKPEYKILTSKINKINTDKVSLNRTFYNLPSVDTEFNNLIYSANYAYGAKANLVNQFVYYNNSNNEDIYKYYIDYTASYAIKVLKASAEDSLKIALGGSWLNTELALLNRVGKTGTVSLDNTGIHPTNYTYSTINYEITVYKNKYIATSILSFIENGLLKDYFNKEYINYTGLGAGFRVYFRRTTIPAIGGTLYTNLKTKRSGFKVFIGASF